MRKFKVSFITKCFASIISVIIIIFYINLLIQNYFMEGIYLENKKDVKNDEIDLFIENIIITKAKDIENSGALEEFEDNIENTLIIIDEKDQLGERILSDDFTRILTKYSNSTYLKKMEKSFNDQSVEQSVFYQISSSPTLLVRKDMVFTSDGIKVYIVTLLVIDEILSIFNTLNKYYMIQYLITVAIIIGFGIIFTIKFKKPVESLKIYADDIAQTKFKKPIMKSRNDELGELFESLNQISDNLSQKMELIYTQKNNEVEERKRITRLLANLSHEFKTPLGVISGFVEMISDGIQVENHQEFLAVIDDEVNNLNLLVNESLELTKYESKIANLNETSFNIKPIVNKNIKKFDNELRRKNLKCKETSTDLEVLGDIKKIDQVVSNLISNAIKYSYENEIIDIRLIDDGKQVSIEIENTCDEISDEDLTRLWDAYYRNDTSRSKQVEGSGLGLSIVKHILELHGSDYGAIYKANKMKVFFNLQRNFK